MITTRSEWSTFLALVSQLEDTIKAVGECDHGVNICCCGEKRLLEEAYAVIVKHKKRGYYLHR